MYLNDRHVIKCEDIVLKLVQHHYDSIWIMHTNYEREIPLRMATVVGNAMTEFYLINNGNARRAAGAGSRRRVGAARGPRPVPAARSK